MSFMTAKRADGRRIGLTTSRLASIIAERDGFEQTGEMAETWAWIRRNGWQHVSPRDAWDALGPAWDALEAACQSLADHEADTVRFRKGVV